MAVTIVSSRSTPGRLIYRLNQDGLAGTTLTINNAALIATAASENADSPVRQLIGANLADNAAAQAFALSGAGEDGSEGSVVTIHGIGTAGAWAVDASQVANALQFDITAPAGADDAFLVIHAMHSLDR